MEGKGKGKESKGAKGGKFGKYYDEHEPSDDDEPMPDESERVATYTDWDTRDTWHWGSEWQSWAWRPGSSSSSTPWSSTPWWSESRRYG